MAEVVSGEGRLSPEDRKNGRSAMAGFPSYVGPDGRVFDVSYDAIDPAVVETIFERFRETRDESEKAQNQQAVESDVKEKPAEQSTACSEPQISMFLPSGNWDVMNKMPKPDAYESYYDFEQALLDWKAEVDNALGYLRIPNVVGRTYHRPQFQLQEEKNVDEPEEEPAAAEPAATTEAAASQPANPAAPATAETKPASETAPAAASPQKEEEKQEVAQEIPIETEKTDEEYEHQFEEITEETNKETPWDSYLVPPEPDPTLYESFDDYEAALVKWYAIAQEHLGTHVPPECSQFKDLLGLTPVQAEVTEEEGKAAGVSQKDQDKKDGGEDKNAAIERRVPWRTGFVALHDKGFEPTTPTPPVSYHDYVWSDQNLYRRVSMDVRGNLHKVVDKLVEQIDTNNTKLGRKVPHSLPRLHGTMQRKYCNVALKAQTSPVRPVRRTDLTVQMFAQCQDAPHKIDTQLVEFIVPEYDKAIDPKKLNDAAYVADMKKSISDLQYIDWTAPNESWNYPLTPLDDQKKIIAVIKQSLSSGAVITGEILRSIIEKPLMTDLFEEFLDTVVKTPQKTAKAGELLVQGMTADTLESIMGLMNDSCSQMLQFRLASVILRLLCDPTAEPMLTPIIKDCKLQVVYNIASCMSNRLSPDAELVVYDKETLALAPMALKAKSVPEVGPILSHVFLVYYLNVMTNSCDGYESNFPAKTLSDRIKQCKELLFPSWSRIASANLGKQLQQCPEFVSELMFDVINSRSAKLSSIFLFVAIQIITNPSPLIQEILKSDTTDIIQHMRDLCCSKFLHARFAGRRLHSLLSTHSLWVDYFCKTYSKRDLILSDLFDFRRRSQAVVAVKNRRTSSVVSAGGVMLNLTDSASTSECSLLTTLATEWMMANVKLTGTPATAQFALEQFIFHSILKVVLEAPREMISVGGGVTLLSDILAHMAKVCFVRDMIKPAKSQYNPKLRDSMTKGPGSLDIHHQDLRNVLNFIVAVPAGPAGYGVKKNMLMCLRHLLKNEEIFSMIKVEPDLYQKLISFCRDGTDHEFNRNAWSLFYQIIRYHNGVMEHLIKTNQLSSFLEIVDTNAGKVIITNGLHYIGKLFKMHSLELQRIEQGKKPARPDAAKSVEKDVKALINFYVKSRLFIRIHMIYQNFCAKRPGMAFFELCEFYKMLRDTPACKQLLKDLQKSGEYKDGIEKVLGMFENVEPPQEKGKKK